MNTGFMRSNAVANVKGGKEFPDISGQVKFYQKSNGVLVVADISGLPRNTSGFFALHIYEGDNCRGENFSDTKGHFNPTKMPHPMHDGDLPPLLSNRGRAHLEVITNRFRVNDIIGRTVVIHNEADDFHSQPAGNSGTKIACGVIRRERPCQSCRNNA